MNDTNPTPGEVLPGDAVQPDAGSIDALSVAFATDSLTRIYGIPGEAASAIRRFGMGLVGRISPLRDRLMKEARGTSGDLPLLLRGLPI